jgi:hypothetical protein
MQNDRQRSAQLSYDNQSPPESDESSLLERFDDLPAEHRAETLRDFLDLHSEVTGKAARTIPVFAGTQELHVVHADLTADFERWLADNPDRMEPGRDNVGRALRLIRGVMPWASQSAQRDLEQAVRLLERAA